MINTQYLVKKIADSGKKKQYLAEKIGVTRAYLMDKCNNKVEFRLNEVNILCEELGIDKKEREAIFFAKSVTKNSDKE